MRASGDLWRKCSMAGVCSTATQRMRSFDATLDVRGVTLNSHAGFYKWLNVYPRPRALRYRP
jgi:hypothetical protein